MVVSHVDVPPALHAALGEPELETRALSPRTRGHGFVDKAENHFAFPSPVPLSPSPQISWTFF